MTRFLPAVSRLVPLLAAAGLILSAVGAIPVGRAAAEDAPAFRGTTLCGKTVTPENLHAGRPYALLTFFGINCLPCQKKLAQLNEIWSDERVRRQAAFYAVNADGFDAGKLESEIARRGIRIDFPVLPDDNQAITNLYVNGIVPLTVLIDNEFNILMSALGARPEAMKKMEDRILNRSKEAAK